MAKRGSVTLSDVARLAGVSAMTVSNVINNRVNVSVANRERVLKAIRESGYQVNAAARSLKYGRSGVIGLAVPDLANIYFGVLAAHLVEQAKRRGYDLAVEQTGAVAEGEAAAIARSRRLQFDGLILTAVELDPQLSTPQTKGYPMVMLGEQDASGRFDHIMIANEDGTEAATEHLIAQGCRTIAIVTGPDLERLTVVTRRYNGYRAALERDGRRAEPELRFVLDSLSLEGGRIAGHEIAGSPLEIDGVVALTDTVAFGVMRGLLDRGIRVPEDIRVIGFDDIPESGYSIPTLSTVNPDYEWIAAKAIDLIVARIEDPTRSPSQHVAPYELKLRGSTA